MPAELEAYFAQQLVAAGWTRQGGQAEGMVAWSLWQVPDPPGTQRFLLLRAAPPPTTSSSPPAESVR